MGSDKELWGEKVVSGDQSAVLEKESGHIYIPWWRRTYLVNREMQFRYARSALVVGAVTTFMSVALLLWAFWSFNIWQGQRLPTPVLVCLGAGLVINLCGVFFVTIVITHRVVGPMFNLLRQFSHVARGDFSAMARFREQDEMHYVARRFNEMVMMLRVRNDFVVGKVDEAIRALNTGDADAARTALSLILEMRKREVDAGSSENP